MSLKGKTSNWVFSQPGGKAVLDRTVRVISVSTMRSLKSDLE